MASMPRFDAASISTRSIARPSRIDAHDGQLSHGSPSWRFVQLTALARMRASEVLPVPRGPTNRIACATRLVRTALRSVSTTASWPTTWANVCARQRRYSAWCACGWIEVGWSVTWTGRLRGCARARESVDACRAPPVDHPTLGPSAEGDSDQAVPRHPTSFAECCFLPDLTRFA